MKRISLLLFAILTGACATPAAPEAPADAAAWTFDARIAESCCCDAVCPCIIGGAPTMGHCVGNRLVEIESGRIGEADVSGTTLIVTFRIGEWTRLWFDDDVTAEQMESAVALLRAKGGFVYGDLLSTERVPLEIERTDGRLVYATPQTRTDIEVVRGRDGRPVEIANLSSFDDYVQYRAVVVNYEGEGGFEHSGTNGFTARVRGAATE